MSDWNNNVIEEFRDNDGLVGGPFEGKPVLLLHHKGAKTGTERVSPLMYQTVDNGFAVFASKGGADHNPDWYHNLRANPEIEVEIGTKTLPVRARVAEGEERERIWVFQKESQPQFADYEAKTSRSAIPVLVLEPR